MNHKEAIQEIDEAIEGAKKQGITTALAPLLKLKAELGGLFKDESGGENLIINIDLDHSQVCFLKDKITKLEEENKKLKEELAIFGANLHT